MKFYTIDDCYIAHLKEVDTRVCDNYGGARIYVGPVLKGQSLDYFAPLTSPKNHHDRITASDVRYLKLRERGSDTSALGMIRLCNMIPLVSGAFELVDVASRDPSYQRLLQKQIRFIVSSRVELERRAKVVYGRVAAKHPEDMVKDCCDFAALEASAEEYSESKVREPVVGILQHNRTSASRDARPLLKLKREIDRATTPDQDT